MFHLSDYKSGWGVNKILPRTPLDGFDGVFLHVYCHEEYQVRRDNHGRSGVPYLSKKLCHMLEFEFSKNQRQGCEFFLGRWIL